MKGMVVSMEGIKRLLSYTRRAVDDYDMISEEENIAVGLSAGKDSLALLLTLARLSKFHPKHFQVTAITIDMGFPDTDYSGIQELCRNIGVPYHIFPSEIAKIVFDIRKESNPCSLCAKMRRGMLNEAALSLGIRKIALGHHFDDAVETFMLNLLHEGRIGCFSPVTYLDRKGVTLIRPFLYVPEKDIRSFARKAELPILESRCPANGKTEREQVKILLTTLEKKHKGVKHRIFGAMQRAEIDGYHPDRMRKYADLTFEETDESRCQILEFQNE